jgi:large subunit ribosomal protein L5
LQERNINKIMTETLLKKIEKITPELKKELGVKNTLAVPRLVKVVVSSGTGRAKDKKRNELVADRLGKITGQKPSPRSAKQSIASFKLREGEVIGMAVTLRGKRMYLFLDKLINVAMPRTRDFKGFDEKSVDEMGNLTIGIKEHVIFPETADEELKDVFGFAITMVTTAKNRDEALAFFRAINFPFKKAKK